MTSRIQANDPTRFNSPQRTFRVTENDLARVREITNGVNGQIVSVRSLHAANRALGNLQRNNPPSQ